MNCDFCCAKIGLQQFLWKHHLCDPCYKYFLKKKKEKEEKFKKARDEYLEVTEEDENISRTNS